MMVEGYGRKRYKGDFIKYLVFAQAECDETIIHLDFLYETQSLKDKTVYERLNEEYELLSKKINKFIQWAEINWNDFGKPETDNK
jgi:four helix bundle protein